MNFYQKVDQKRWADPELKRVSEVWRVLTGSFFQKIIGENRFVLPDDRHRGIPLLSLLMLMNLFRASYFRLPLWFCNQGGKYNNNSCSTSISLLNILRITQSFPCRAALCMTEVYWGVPPGASSIERCGMISFQGKA